MRPRTLVDLLVLGLIWGASFLMIKIGIAEIEPLTFAMARVAIGAATLWIFWRRGGAAFPLDSRALTCFAILGLVGIALPFALSTWGTQFIPSGLSAILNATMPLFTIILAAASGAEDLSWRRSAGVLCGFGGILLVTWPGLRGELGAGQAGQAAVVLAALCSAAGIVYARHKAAGLSPLALSTLWLLPVIVAQRPWAAPGPSWAAVAAALAIGTLGTGVAYVLYYRLLADLGATGASLVTFMVPIFGIFWGWAVLGERLTGEAFVALGAIIMGSMMVNDRPFGRISVPHTRSDS
jgi:drug/metabolite transporter (DMT)-like permease